MFKIYALRNFMDEDPKKRKKIEAITIVCGYRCNEALWCPNGADCKYLRKNSHSWNNFLVELRRVSKIKLKKEIHIPIYFSRHSANLSGTTKCPYHMDRVFTCKDCIYSSDINCTNKERLELVAKGRGNEVFDPGIPIKCKLFKINEWSGNYDKRTGDTLV